MTTNIDFFNFEERDEGDIPFYNKYYPLSKIGLIALIIAYILPILFIFHMWIEIPIPTCLFIFIPGFVGIGIACKGHFEAIFKKFKKSDIKLIVVIIILEFIVSVSISLVEFYFFGMKINANPVLGRLIGIMDYIALAIQLMGEEFIKLIGLVLFMYLFYRITNNRKLAMIIGIICSLTIFGLLHVPAYDNVIHSIVAIGWASILTMYAYIKTKNIWVSFIIHFLFDVIASIIALLSF